MSLDFLKAVRPKHTPKGRPRVTLTFAQSIDAKISGENGAQLILSGKESMVMTHWMRTMHDGILVGIGTALNDDPQLNTRHLPTREGGYRPPQPIILDSHLRLSTNCKLLKNFNQGTGLPPWIMGSNVESSSPEWIERKNALEAAGARVYTVEASSPGKLAISSLLATLHGLGITSLMVEGGAAVIGEFLRATAVTNSTESLVDSVIITVAPTIVGKKGVGYSADAVDLQHLRTEILGKDTVSAFTVSRRQSS